MAFLGPHGGDRRAEPARRLLVSSRFRIPARILRTANLPGGGHIGPGSRSRPETQSFLDEWPCAVLADEIDAGNIRAVLNLGGAWSLRFPTLPSWFLR
jgi:hypothetical protein